MINALILAGSSRREELEQQENVDNKAQVTIKGLPMMLHVLSALNQVSDLEKISIVTSGYLWREVRLDQEEITEAYEIIEEQGGLLENLEAGLKAMPPERSCLVITSDIPLIQPEAVEDFISRCLPLDRDFYYPIIQRKNCEAVYPQAKRTYLKIKDGVYTGGNMALVKPSSLLNNINRLQLFFSYRKKPWKYAKLLSPVLVFKFITRQVTIKELENHISRALFINARAVETPFIEVGTDVDKPSDLEMVRNIMGES